MEDQYKIIRQIADANMKFIYENGFTKAGINGPYHCTDTDVRNTAHWIYTYHYLWEKEHELKYYNVLKILSDNLCREEYCGASGAVKCMLDNKMDHLNGTIGQGWAIEGLIAAYLATDDEKYFERAVSIFLSQTYDFSAHLWMRVELDGTNIGIDRVFNHQLWFAASGSLILECKNVEQIKIYVDDFIKNLDILFDIHEEGLFKHYVVGYEKNADSKIKSMARKYFSFLKFFDPRFDQKSFEKAYHIFTLYGFALLYKNYSEEKIFQNKKLVKAISYVSDIDKLTKSFNIQYFTKNNANVLFRYNKYAYSYNSPAFEFPYVDYVLNHGKKSDLYMTLWNMQLGATFDKKQKKFSRNTDDPETLTARIYELVRYLELKDMSEKG